MITVLLPQRWPQGSSALHSPLRLRQVVQKAMRDGVQVDDLAARVCQTGGGGNSLTCLEQGGVKGDNHVCAMITDVLFKRHLRDTV